MYQGSTPTHEFVLPFETSFVKTAVVTYKQGDKIVLEKAGSFCTLEGNIVKVTLTQRETLSFDANKDVRVQLRILTNDGKALTSQIKKVSVEEALNKEVLV